ncbi:hypothetical protein NEOLI_000849 [Neolecta irregularis DAH-3]|uniref:Uncharacterized protein n=1 Tax=Neolecta irregularis (strain DAH-3) TaxID=1198029 RepID=A0A1U7LKU1_NEOID|nr:hypothetical protein NEOLI_000849 [Neolecta irregularis DAH-3]|eukprot:OLL23259.1 hypothetical protein NEOLI_000849 [Neolecta irregularis DAH-3]
MRYSLLSLSLPVVFGAPIKTVSYHTQLDFGICGDVNPKIIYTLNLDVNAGNTFEPESLQDFPQSPAGDIGQIVYSICRKLDKICQASKITLDICQAAGQAASKAPIGQFQADAFNGVWESSVQGGISTETLKGGIALEGKLTARSENLEPKSEPGEDDACSADDEGHGGVSSGNGNGIRDPAKTIPPVESPGGLTKSDPGQDDDCSDDDDEGHKGDVPIGNGTGSIPSPGETASAAQSPGGSGKPGLDRQNTGAGSSKLDLGTCTDATIRFGMGFPNFPAQEFRYKANNTGEFPHDAALRARVIMEFICDTLVNNCNAPQQSKLACDQIVKEIIAKDLPLTGAIADDFNRGLGFDTNFAAIKTDAESVATTVINGETVFLLPLDPKCKDPTILYGAGLGGRSSTEFSFKANNSLFFGGTAFNAEIVGRAICDGFQNNCGLKLTQEACSNFANSDDLKSKAKSPIFADIWNKRFNLTSDFAHSVQKPL